MLEGIEKQNKRRILEGKILTNKRVGRQERKRHLKAFLEGLEFLLVHTGVHHHQKDGRHNLEKRSFALLFLRNC